MASKYETIHSAQNPNDVVATWEWRISRGLKLREEEEKRWRENMAWEDMRGVDPAEKDPLADKITINKIGSHIANRIPSIMYKAPGFTLQPEHPDGLRDVAFDLVGIEADAEQQTKWPAYKMNEATLNYLVRQPSFEWRQNLRLSLRSAFVGYAAMKTGYAPDYEGTLFADEHLKDADGRVVMKDGDPVPAVRDKWFSKWMPFWRLILDPDGENSLRDHRWIACEYLFTIDELKKNKAVKVPKDLKGTCMTYKFKEDDTTDASMVAGIDAAGVYRPRQSTDEEYEFQMVRVFEIFDFVEKKLLWLAEGADKPLRNSPLPPGIDHSPYTIMMPVPRLGKPYGRPPVSDMIPLTKEYQLARGSLQTALRHVNRKWLVRKGSFDPANLLRLKSPLDNEVIETEETAPWDQIIHLVPQHGVDGQMFGYIQNIAHDLDEMGGAPASARERARTATAISSIDSQSAIRDDDMREQFSVFAAEIGKKLLDSVQQNATSEDYVRIAGTKAPLFIKMDPENLVGDYDVSVNVQEMMPRSSGLKMQQVVNLLTLFKGDPWLASDPVLVEELLDLAEIRSPRLRDALSAVAAKQAAALLQPQAPPGQAPPPKPGQMPQTGGDMMSQVLGGVAGGGGGM